MSYRKYERAKQMWPWANPARSGNSGGTTGDPVSGSVAAFLNKVSTETTQSAQHIQVEIVSADPEIVTTVPKILPSAPDLIAFMPHIVLCEAESTTALSLALPQAHPEAPVTQTEVAPTEAKSTTARTRVMLQQSEPTTAGSILARTHPEALLVAQTNSEPQQAQHDGSGCTSASVTQTHPLSPSITSDGEVCSELGCKIEQESTSDSSLRETIASSTIAQQTQANTASKQKGTSSLLTHESHQAILQYVVDVRATCDKIVEILRDTVEIRAGTFNSTKKRCSCFVSLGETEGAKMLAYVKNAQRAPDAIQEMKQISLPEICECQLRGCSRGKADKAFFVPYVPQSARHMVIHALHIKNDVHSSIMAAASRAVNVSTFGSRFSQDQLNDLAATALSACCCQEASFTRQSQPTNQMFPFQMGRSTSHWENSSPRTNSTRAAAEFEAVNYSPGEKRASSVSDKELSSQKRNKCGNN